MADNMAKVFTLDHKVWRKKENGVMERESNGKEKKREEEEIGNIFALELV